MRPLHFKLALALTACSISASAADVDFECGTDTFEPPTASEPNPFRMSVAQDKRSYEHPIYEGLWPMTVAAFRKIDSVVHVPKNEYDFAVPVIIVEDDGMTLAANEPRALRNSLWRTTRDNFEALDNDVVFGHFTR